MDGPWNLELHILLLSLQFGSHPYHIVRMNPRSSESRVRSALEAFPVVALLDPRQVGKTTRALAVTKTVTSEVVYLDLERDSDLNKLTEAELYLHQQRGKLVILDRVQRRPDLFPLLHSMVDKHIPARDRNGHFLVLGSASRNL